MGKNFEINVMMFGGRRSGKTSILAAMKECVDQVFRDEQELGLSISSLDFDTMKALEEKNQELHLYYSEKDRDEALHLITIRHSLREYISLVFSW